MWWSHRVNTVPLIGLRAAERVGDNGPVTSPLVSCAEFAASSVGANPPVVLDVR